MGASWGDFSLVNTVTGSGAGALTVTGVQKNDLVIAAVVDHGYYGEVPSVAVSGVATSTVLDKNSAPLNGQYRRGAWYYYYPYYYYNYYWYWRYPNWYYYYPVLQAHLKVLTANEAGSVTADFSEPSGNAVIFQTILRVWRPAITVGAGEAVASLAFTESAKAPGSAGNVATIAVAQDDLVVASGVDSSAGYATADISISGPSVQELLDFFPVYAGRSVRMKLWRIKSSATASLTYQNCFIGRMAEKLTPNVEVVQTSYPTVTEPYAYIEIQPELTTAGRVIRPRWFESIRTNQIWATNFGLRKRWMKQGVSEDTSDQGTQISRARIVEMWKIDKDLLSSVPTSGAYVYPDEATAEDRVTALDAGW